ncbi:MAG: hypothetical protein A2651_02495 [Candidatus Yanofskybacteria bacterium RIFCSPHIGHO2_01_FULL_42_12]|uniref:Uncharacterized protein n=1 Tax=Candidatus Yanofskybacteria bacterium RIFCSPLOWO2_01_FULL_42_49 TaxID=1802694 RepID=A0A1F8GB03_9BACT|nr:MAG: hypothetical protein A2651_02495 [Candidatus Yanofskybacteria bacterium RIFCSPHIGHO2_01_FULL_42_12]OGN22547.1 MAG: hypothetical protein A2918_02180 [Candidatus Yanofskybacteria bacterium RIFCSPLOWO2_01_FULL_42_49]
MAEGQSFEKHEAPVTKPETGPEVDIESVLERGEIVDSRPLEGAERFDVVEIRDDGKGLFRPKESEARGRPLRVQLELLARLISKTAELGVVPEVVMRTVNQEEGTLQRFLGEATPAVKLEDDCLREISDEELFRAVLFEHLIKAADRKLANIFLERTKKIWLTDHDDFMFADAKEEWNQYNYMLGEAKRRGLKTEINDESREPLRRLVEALERLLVDPREIGVETVTPTLIKVITGVKQIAATVLETGTISI